MRRLVVAAGVFACLGGVFADPPPSGAEGGVRLLSEVTPGSQRAVETGLAFLARVQAADGSWCAQGGQYRAAMTALAGLAFLAHSDTPERGEYAGTVRRALEFILRSQNDMTGLIASEGDQDRSMYGHGFAMLFLGEVYGMTGRGVFEERIRRALQKGAALSTRSQSRDGGWYYVPNAGQDEGSVTITQVQGLRAARNVGIDVPKESITRAILYIRNSMNPDGGVRYRAQGGGEGRPAITAAGMAVIFNAGEFTEETRGMLERGMDYVRRNMLTGGPAGAMNTGHFFYTHFYLAQAMFLSGGEDWDRYFPPVRDHLISMQQPDGAWRQEVGDAYCTGIACLILQMPYRYLPILQE
ncbi:MAG: terpene cyclase/mutase family protein [Planctomycetes bacterium]|nr:terpene cyclase/mutase family protein [Planctomycetota bacterium]